MTKDEFLTRMERALTVLAPHERIDILSDYVEHFRMGEENGKTDEEIAESLGSPEELAKTFLEQKGINPQAAAQNSQAGSAQNNPVPPYGQPSPNRPYANEAPYGQPGSSSYSRTAQPAANWAQPARRDVSNQTVATVLVVLFNIFIGIPFLLSVCSFLLAVPATALGLFIASIALIVVSAAFAGTALAIASILCFSVALLALAVLLGVATIAIVKAAIKLITIYVNFCIRICREGRWPAERSCAA